MNAVPTAIALPDLVSSALEGHQMAVALVAELQCGCALPDKLHVVLQNLRASGDGEQLRTFTRVVQKAVEVARTAAGAK